MKSILTWLLLFTVPAFAQTEPIDSLTIVKAVEKTKTPKSSGLIIPGMLISYGAISLLGNTEVRSLDYTTHAELQEDHPTFAFKIDNYTRYVPAIAVYGLDLIGVKAKNNVKDRTGMLILSVGLVTSSVGATKLLVHRLRPNGADNRSFPSGHTSLAFMTAEFLHQEYKDRSLWISIGGYAIATGTGALRLYNNAHWLSDVVAGAGCGILSTKVSYWIYPSLKRKFFKNKPVSMQFSPSYQNGNAGFNFNYQF
jgi:membrane-associated phospholipid phosphatase